jgi:Uma2 family endonuclease
MIVLKQLMESFWAITGKDEFYLSLDVRELALTDDQYFRLCRDNSDFRIELSAKGELIIMSPNKPRTGRKQSIINQRMRNWAEMDGSGEVFDATSEFTLANGAKRAPDASWILKTRWNALTEAEMDTFSPICPDFVLELRSPSDRVKLLKAKMEEYIANGARLGWLLDPIRNRAYLYVPGKQVEVVDAPETLSGDPVLPGFRFNFREIL